MNRVWRAEDHRRFAAERFYPELANTALLCCTEMSRRRYGRGRGGVWKEMIKESPSHITQNEPLLFERSSPGKMGYQLPDLDVPAVDPARRSARRTCARKSTDFPEVSEVDAIRHFTRLSTWNYAIDLGLYPLGSCTMKYNPRVNEQVARIEG